MRDSCLQRGHAGSGSASHGFSLLMLTWWDKQALSLPHAVPTCLEGGLPHRELSAAGMCLLKGRDGCDTMCMYIGRVAFSSLPPKSVTAATSLLEPVSFLPLCHPPSAIQTRISRPFSPTADISLCCRNNRSSSAAQGSQGRSFSSHFVPMFFTISLKC